MFTKKKKIIQSSPLSFVTFVGTILVFLCRFRIAPVYNVGRVAVFGLRKEDVIVMNIAKVTSEIWR